MTTSFYSREELSVLGFHSIGENCKISRKASFYSIQNISIGNNVRIDDYCILSGHIKLGNNIHISAYVALYGAKGIEFEDNMKVTNDLLDELGATENRIVVFNKCDLLKKPIEIKENEVLISTKEKTGIDNLLAKIRANLEK